MEHCCPRYIRRRIGLAVALALASPPGVAAQAGDEAGKPPAQDGAAAFAGGRAQDARQPPSTRLGTVIVTANKRSERSQDVPMAVSVLDDTRLERQNALGFADYAAQVPGLNIISSGAGWTQLVLRGVTSGSRQPNATVGTYIDDMPFGSSTVYAAGSVLTPDIDPGDLQRIEVLRGPQGTLYGSNTLGGLLKFVTTPPDTTQASARAGFSTSHVDGGGSGYGARASANLPLVADTLGLRVSVYHRDDPGYIRNVVTGRSEIDEAKVSGGRAQLLWTPDDKVSVRFSALAQNLGSDGLANQGIDVDPATLRPVQGWPNQARAAGTGMFKIKYRLYGLTVNADFGWARLVSTTSYGTLRFNENTDITSVYGPVLNPLFGLDDGGYSELQPIALNKATQELRLQSPADRTWEWRAGAFFTREHTTDDQDILGFDARTGAPIALPTLGSVSVGPAVFREWAGYGDLTWHATPRLGILVGARYSSDSTSYTQTSSGLLIGDAHFTTRGSDHPVTYLFNPSYKFGDDLMAYLRVASGFRPGGPNVGVPPGLGAPLTFGPDKLVNYELGLKSLLLDRRMSVEADVFYIDWSKVQLTATAGGFSFLGNAGRATRRGAELSWSYRPLAGLTLWANATYTNARLAADTPAGGIYGLKGDPLPYVPKWSANLGADYNFPLGGGGWSGFVGGNLSYVGARASDFNSTPAPRMHLSGYNNLDLHAGVNYANWTVEVYAKNLADRRGITAMWPETLGETSGPYQASYQAPRTIGMSASVEF